MSTPGKFTSPWKAVVIAGFLCSKCEGTLEYRNWESDCEGFEDQQFRCTDCRHTWWIEGSDS